MSEKMLKTITVRGVDSNIYDQFSKTIQSAEMNIGSAINQMMSDVMKDFDEVFPELSAENLRSQVKKPIIDITGHRDLTINKDDLISAGKRVEFSHIENLKFEADITKEIFLEYVLSVSHCEMVEVPSVLPKLIVLSRINHSDQVEIYNVDSHANSSSDESLAEYQE